MALSRTSSIAAAALGLATILALPVPALAQFHAPKTIEQLEEQPQKPQKPDVINDDEGLPTDTGPDPDDLDAQQNPPEHPVQRPVESERPMQSEHVRAGPSVKSTGSSRHASSEILDGGAPDVGSDGGAANLSGIDGGLAEAQPLALPKSSWASLLDAWAVRRKGVQDHNPKSQLEAEKVVAAQREELGIRDLTGIAAALDHEATRQLQAKNPAEANRLVDLAVRLAPDSPSAHFAKARVRLTSDLSNAGEALVAVRDGAVRAFSEPETRLALWGNLGAAGALGLSLAAVLALLALVVRTLRYALHDFHHLFPRGALPAQTAVLFALVLLLPWAFKLGPMAELCALVGAVFLYLRTVERVLATALLGLLAAVPLLSGLGARHLAYSGTLAQAVDRVEQGGPDAARAVARLEALEKSNGAGAPELIALGLNAKRAGQYPLAIERFKKALALSPRSAEAQNDLGNALLLSGDLDGARDCYLRASELAPDSAVVNYNLAKVSVRRAQLYTATRDVSDDIERGKAATAAVYRLDRALMDRPSDERANLFVMDLELPAGAVAVGDGEALQGAVASQLRARLWGSAAPGASEVFAAGILLGFWGLAFGSRKLKPSVECDRCGRPVCGRCDREVSGTSLCGQCHNAFMKKGAVDPQTRLRKEASAKRYQERWQKARRLASYALAGMGHLLGRRPLLGALFLAVTLVLAVAVALGEGLFRVPFGGTLSLPRQVLAGVLLVGLWLLSIRSYRAGEDGRRA